MINPGLNDKAYPVFRLAALVRALRMEGVSIAQALEQIDLSESDLTSPATRVSLNQLIQCCRNALRFSQDPFFAYYAGLQFHVSTYGMYGFAILCTTNMRQAIHFVVQHNRFATPLATILLSEGSGRATWTITPVSHPDMDAALYRFIVEMYIGAQTRVHRDIMGLSFEPLELRCAYGPTGDPPTYALRFGCPVLFEQRKNQFTFDLAWLNASPDFGGEVPHAWVAELCDRVMAELKHRPGFTGEVRRALLDGLARPATLDTVAERLTIPPSTLRRQLQEEGASFRTLADELRMQVGTKYLRETYLSIADISLSLGFTDAANFRHTFRRWLHETPGEYRDRVWTSHEPS